jgi:hypothetical protein
MARFYSNESFPQPTVLKLRELGHDVLATCEAGNADEPISDEAVLAHAVDHERAVLTLNRKHFVALHYQVLTHSGIVVCCVDADCAGQAQRIHEAVSRYSELAGMLIRVNRAHPEAGIR